VTRRENKVWNRLGEDVSFVIEAVYGIPKLGVDAKTAMEICGNGDVVAELTL
jgi:hypothetical protein